MEKLDFDVKTIAEQYDDIAKKLEKIDKIDERLQKHDAVHFKLEWGIEILQNRAGTVNAKLDRLENELNTVEPVVKDVDTKAVRIEKKLDTVTQNHEERIKKLELVK